MQDKVRVEEVQDALRRLTESFQARIEGMHQDLSLKIVTKNEDCYLGLERLKADIEQISNSLKKHPGLDQIESLQNQIDFLSKDVGAKADRKGVQSQIEFLSEAQSQTAKDMLLKANIQDVMAMLDKKACNDDLLLDMSYLKQALQKHAKDFRLAMDQQNQINEALCAENCVVRFLWKHGRLDHPSAVAWDLQSVNTCPENFAWKQSSIAVEAPGLYEVTLAFFSRAKKPLVQVLLNGEVAFQSNSICKVICNGCGTSTSVATAKGGSQKSVKGDDTVYKISMVEFLVLPAKA